MAELQQLNAELLTSSSATAALEHWCTAHHLADPPRVSAERLPGDEQAPTREQRRLLQVGAGEVVRYRRVRLRCGVTPLSEADNWYVPGRLTSAMNQQLDGSEVPFGRVVQPLNFSRRTLATQLRRRPSPLLVQRALLVRADGQPISLVVERYSLAAP